MFALYVFNPLIRWSFRIIRQRFRELRDTRRYRRRGFMVPRRTPEGRVRYTSMPRRLLHYLRNERRRLGFTQADIAALLGVQWKTRVSRYERGPALPPLDTGFAYQKIYGKHVSDIFAGTNEKVGSGVRERARDLLAKSPAPHTAAEARRIRSLERIAA